MRTHAVASSWVHLLAWLVALTTLPSLHARGGWRDIAFLYVYEADAGQDAYVNSFNTIGNLDGQWRRSDNSDQWDGSTPEPGDAAPGGIDVQVLAGEAEDGGDASVLDLEDAGDPRGAGFPDPGNRKLYLWRDTTDELDLARGVTLVARWRLNPEPRSDEFANNGGAIAVPSGTHLHDQNKGQIGFVQKSAASGTLAATLAFAITDAGTLQFFQAFNNTPCSGALFPDELCLDVDESGWVTVWMTAIEEAGSVHFKVYLNGEPDPQVDEVRSDIRADAENASRPEGGGAASSYLLMALGSTGQDGAIQIDYLAVADGATDPPLESEPCPGAARSRVDGADILVEWTNGAAATTSVAIARDGVGIGTVTDPNAQAFRDGTAEPGIHEYTIQATVPGSNCGTLTTTINTCPESLSAAPLAGGVRLNWANRGPYAGLSVSRDGTVVAGSLPGTATTYDDLGVAGGTHTYSVAPTNGTCAPVEATIRYFQPPAAPGDFSAVETEWSYSLDPPPNADRNDYAFDNPIPNEVGDLDGNWSSGNGSDSWDGSAPGEVGDPLLDVAGVVDPASAAPGGIGLVTDGAVGAYLFEDVGDPTTLGYLDPSNRKLYLAYDASLSIADAQTRSLINDGVTLRARFRLTPADRAVDVTDAPNGYQTQNAGKGMFSLVHDAAATAVGTSQRIPIALDLNPIAPAEGLLYIGDEAGQLTVPIANPTAWLDVWMTVEDPDPSTPEVSLKVFLNGSATPVVDVEDFLPNPQGSEGGVAVTPGNALYMGLNTTADSGSMEVDLVCLLDGAVAPGTGPSVPKFHRGDSNNDGNHNISDPVNTLNVLFLGTGSIPCQDAADSNDDGQVNISDPVNSLNVLFLGTGAVPPPLPPEALQPCGEDPTAEASDLGCVTYSHC